jgi:outer membrane lipoprotein carrier protein
MVFFLYVCLLGGFDFDMKSFESDFEQHITNELNDTITYTGRVYAKRLNTALWVYKTPIEKDFYYIDGEIVIIEPELEQVTYTQTKEIPNLLEVISNAKEISKGVFLASCCEQNATVKIIDDKIAQVEYKDKLENGVTIKFKNQQVNKNIDNEVFRIKFPQGYDILRQ